MALQLLCEIDKQRKHALQAANVRIINDNCIMHRPYDDRIGRDIHGVSQTVNTECGVPIQQKITHKKVKETVKQAAIAKGYDDMLRVIGV